MYKITFKRLAILTMVILLIFRGLAWQFWHVLDFGRNEPYYNLLSSPIASGQYQSQVEQARVDYVNQGRNYAKGSSDYQPYGYFIDLLSTQDYHPSSEISFDDRGIPMVKYEDKFHYNPVTVAQFALSAYAEYLDGKRDEALFLTATDKLIHMMDPDGAYRYPFTWKNPNSQLPYEKGWVSALAQGHALSCYARAYQLTADPKYIEAGEASLKFLLTDKKDGGVRTTLADLSPALQNKPFFEEYVSTPDSYTLNGYMFTLIGLYDWATLVHDYPRVLDDHGAQYYFDQGVESLCYVIGLYDVGGFTCYDLGYMNYSVTPKMMAGYHAMHIKLLHNLYSIKPMERLKQYELLWISYVDKHE